MRQCPKCSKRFLENNARVCDVDGAVLDVLVVASERDRLIGTTILQRYAIDGVLGDGGMGVVYRAVDSTSGRRFAVKVLRAEYSAEEELVVRFEQEARAAAAVRNPHIVEIYDWGSLPDNSRFFVMEYLEGRSLGDVLARGGKPKGSDRRKPLSDDLTVHIAMQIAEGLAAAHAIGVVHRDIKPDNFHLIRRGDDPYFVKILDFGIAKVQNSKAAKTRTGSVFGTPHYMSPEQASGDRNIDATTDIYGLGVLMYEMVSGKVPFDADNLMGILTAHLYHMPVPPRTFPECEGLSPSFEAVILKCLAKTREARYGSMEALADDLVRCRAGQTALALEDQECSTVRFSRATMALPPEGDEATRPDMPIPDGGAPIAIAPSPSHPPSWPSPHASPVPSASPLPSSVVRTASSDPSLPPRRPAVPSRSRLPLVIAAVIGVGTCVGLAVAALAGLRDTSAIQSTARDTTVPTLAPPAPVTPPAAPVVQRVVAPTPLHGTAAQPGALPGTLAGINRTVPGTVHPDAHPTAPPGVASLQSPVMLESEAAEARVSRAGRTLGALPVEVPRPSNGDDTYDVDAPGYDRVQVRVGPASPRVLRVVLSRHVRPSHRDDPHAGHHGSTGPRSLHGHGPSEIRDPWAQ